MSASQLPQTAMAAAMARAGVNTAAARLRVLAEDILRRPGSDRQHLDDMRAAVAGKCDLFDATLQFYLDYVAADMRGDGLPGRGHSAVAGDGQSGRAPARQPSEDGTGQSSVAVGGGQHTGARPSSPVESEGTSFRAPQGHSPVAPSLSPVDVGRADCTAPQGQRAIARPASPFRDGAGQQGCASTGQQSGAGPVAIREPSPAFRRAAAGVAKAVAITVLDLTKTSDGRAWGDVGAHELDGMARDGAIARAVRARLGILTNEQRFKPLRELIRPDEFRALLREVREDGDAA